MITTTTETAPRVWVSSFGAYNEGLLIGRWVDAVDADQVTARSLFEGTPYAWTEDEELWCFDIENMPIDREMSPYEATRWAHLLNEVPEHERVALAAWVRSGDYVAQGNGDLPSIGDFQERHCGHWDSFRQYAEQLVDDIGMLTEIPDEIARYFDWDAWTRDLRFDYAVESAPSGGVFVFRVM